MSIAPRPDSSKIQYKKGNSFDRAKVSILIKDRRKKPEHNKELVAIFTDIFEKQIKYQQGEISENGNQLVFELKSYDIANSNTGCTVIISYHVSYLSAEKSSIVTEDYFPCVDSERKSLLASHAINKMLREMDDWLASISK